MADKKTTLDSPLDVDRETVKEVGITDDYEVSPVKKLAYLRSQYEELETMVWRSRVDVIHAKRLTESEIPALKHKGLERIDTHMNEVKQFYGGMQMVKRLIDQLIEENPSLAPKE